MELKVLHVTMHCCHWTTFGIPYPSVADKPPFYYVINNRKEEDNGVGMCEGVGSNQFCFEGMIHHELFRFLTKKRVVFGVHTFAAIFSWSEEEEEKGDPGKVIILLIPLSHVFIRCVEGLEDINIYWLNLVRRRVLLCICYELASLDKSGVLPYCCSGDNGTPQLQIFGQWTIGIVQNDSS